MNLLLDERLWLAVVLEVVEFFLDCVQVVLVHVLSLGKKSHK